MAEEEIEDSGSAEGSLPDIPQESSSPADTGSSQPIAADALADFRSLPQFADKSDSEITGALYEALQHNQYAQRALAQYQSVIPEASEYLSNRDLFQEWKQSRSQPQQYQQYAPQQQQAQPAPQPASWWNPPKVKEAYRQYLVRDADGRDSISEAAPLDARRELSDFQAYKADFARKFLEDPQAALGPMVQGIVDTRAQEIAEARISSLKEENFVQRVYEENKDWLEENGRVSREGFLVQKYVEEARRKGISGAESRWDYATAMVERDLALANLSDMQQFQSRPQRQQQPAPPQAPPQESAAERNMAYLRQKATRSTSRRSQATSDPRSPQKPTSFAEKFLANLRTTGMAE
jgi:hypothetical protein